MIALPRSPAVGWWDRAECLGMTDAQTEATFYNVQSDRAVAEAMTLCRRCRVVADCLADALRTEDLGRAPVAWGIRGGMLPSQRLGLLRQRRQAG